MAFSSKKKHVESTRIGTIIGQGSKLEGKITVSGTIRIDGTHIGDIYTDGDVIIGETGFISGNIYSDNVSITGRVEGNVRCKGLLEILFKGILIGDIEAGKISISDGSAFSGKCQMISDSPKDEI
jgi:cytoskeletal protein CcmA (bactofilin family)